MLRLSTTKYNEMAQCPKKYDYHENLKLIPKPRKVKTPLRRGIWVHSCLEVASKGGVWQDRLIELIKWAEEHEVDPDQIRQVQDETAMIMHGYQDYWFRYPSLAPTPKYTEQELTLVIPQLDLTLTATVDLIAEYKGTLALWEYKSTTHIPPANWRGVDPQTAIQFMACKQNGIEIDRIVFDYLLTIPPPIPQVLKNGMFSTRKIATTEWAFVQGVDHLDHRKLFDAGLDVNDYIAEQRRRLVADEKFYQRYDVQKPARYLRETAQDITSVVAHLRLCQASGHWPRAFHPVTCTRMCSYSELCSLEYLSGKPSLLREEEFDSDDGSREGRLDPMSIGLLSSSDGEDDY